MKFSIVTISYNQVGFLKDCIESVLIQKEALKSIGVELEYIVVDPGSNDGSRELIESYGSEIITVFDKDEGPADGLNKGFSIATGDIYCYLNADDYFLPNSLCRINSFFTQDDFDIIYGHGWIVDESGRKIHRCLSHKFSLKQYMLGNSVVMQQSTFFRRKAFIDAGGFNCKNNVSWDGELLVEMVLSGARAKRVNMYLSCFRVYATSISGSGNFLKAARVEHKRISSRISGELNLDLKKKSKFLDRVIFRIIDPYYCLVRAFDGVTRGKRRIPSG